MEKIPPHREGTVPRDPDAHPVGADVQDPCNQGQQEHHAAPGDHGPRVRRRRDDVIKQMLQHVGHQQIGSRAEQLDQHHGQDIPPVGADVAQDQFHNRECAPFRYPSIVPCIVFCRKEQILEIDAAR